MAPFSTPAILIRRLDYGDHDVIATFFSLALGKVALIAKGAKKSRRRFGGVLELFSEVDITGRPPRRAGLAVLQEAVLKAPFAAIRTAASRTAYASYWAELVGSWMEEQVAHPEVFALLRHVLNELDRGAAPAAALSVLFQMRFLSLSGHGPNLRECAFCRRAVDDLPQRELRVELERGGLACPACAGDRGEAPRIAKGPVKQLQWVAAGGLEQAARMRFTPQALRESLAFLESFVPFHLGREPRSLRVLRQLR
jgi:DNA repair protein RecO (recombination protein O)